MEHFDYLFDRILGWNPIMYLSPDSFAPLISLQSMYSIHSSKSKQVNPIQFESIRSLQDIELVDISVDMFVKSTHLDFA